MNRKTVGVLYLSMLASGCSAPGGGRPPALAPAGEAQVVEPDRLVEPTELCAERKDGLRLAWRGAATDEPSFQLDNPGRAPVFVDMVRKGGTYRTGYPAIDVHFRFADDGPWRVAVMQPGTFVPIDLERIALEPGANLVFRVPLAASVSPRATSARLQLRYSTSPRGVAYDACVASAPFELPAPR
jgi:hypothetical protein